MEQRQQKPALTLKYAKRRFDGGNEAELIRAIEVSQMNKLYNHAQMGTEPAHNTFSAPLNLSPNPGVQAQKPQVSKRTRQSRMVEAAITGPLQLCIGVVGMLTATLAIITFRRADNQPMLDQSWIVFRDCRKTLIKGIKDCLTTPIRVVKASLQTV
ncbi:hypothetical protein [Vampirovibrio sp.]|uniref:hypothetical protein n=1 Tax=Vampirovibrio sp. TaxID=2717857 RepID=UPI0035939456